MEQIDLPLGSIDGRMISIAEAGAPKMAQFGSLNRVTGRFW